MIPSARTLKNADGWLHLQQSYVIPDSLSQECDLNLVQHLRDRIRQRCSVELPVCSKNVSDADALPISIIHKQNEGNKYSESYQLSIQNDGITLSGDNTGLLYGIEALVQLLEQKDEQWAWPCLEINDSPAFKWRGLMLDCSRHFLTKEFLLQTIDRMPRLRMNRLHLHLNDDHGWRMEIKAFPELTNRGACVEQGDQQQGFYSQDDLRDIVHYAQQRHIMVIPEIEIPGHAYAAMHSYPDLCCNGKPQRNQGHQKDIYCAGKDATFTFLEKVLTEVVDIFPAPCIHIGGDEAPKDRWRECPDCQQRIQDEGLADEEALQAYMIRRTATFLSQHGKRIIGWEEVLDGGPETDTVVQWWRTRTHGDAALRAALQRGHQVIASPNSYCYLSFPVSPDQHFTVERTSTLEKVYSLDICPSDLSEQERQGILGIECCVWTEHLTEDQIDSMLFPRVLALAEIMWRNPQQRDADVFFKKALALQNYWESAGISYGPWTAEN